MTPHQWDVFISHASEDKETIVRPLASLLRSEGLRVWYDEFSLKLGDSLSRSTDNGLAHSAFGIVVLSPRFFKKQWPRRELDGLVAQAVAQGKPILPLWHEVTRDDILSFSPPLADRVAVDTSHGTEYVAQKILEVSRPLSRRLAAASLAA